MDFLHKWTLSVTVILAVSAVFKFIIPFGNLKKTADALLAIIILCVMISGAVGIKPQYNADFATETPIQESYDKNSAYTDALKSSISALLDENGIAFDELSVNCDIDESGVLTVGPVAITVESEADRDKTYALLLNQYGFDREMLTVNVK